MAGYVTPFAQAITADPNGQIELANKIGEFDFTVLENHSEDPSPSTLELQSVLSWRLDPKEKYIKGSWNKRDFTAEPQDKKMMVDNPGFRTAGEDTIDLVSDLGAAGGRIHFIVRLKIIEERPLAQNRREKVPSEPS